MGQYWIRAVSVAFASFAAIYFSLSITSRVGWLALRKRQVNSSGFLFALLACPLLVAVAVVLFLVIPAFVSLEPVTTAEIGNWALLAFASMGAVTILIGITRAAAAWMRTSRTVRRWSAGASMIDSSPELPILTTVHSSPAVVVTGLARPRMLISSSTARALNPSELRLVVAHEREHARRRDNLRKLLLLASFMPLAKEIEERWALSCELAADRAAVKNGADACDLASALVKVSRLGYAQTPLATNFAAANPAILETRVQQLISWRPLETSLREKALKCLAITALAASAAFFLLYAGSVLIFVQRISELWMN
jgi:Zn-dependent protease with chaperone function